MKKHIVILLIILSVSVFAADNAFSDSNANAVSIPDNDSSNGDMNAVFKPGVRDGSFPKIAHDLINEDFESGLMPSGWIVVDGLSDNHTWVVTDHFDAHVNGFPLPPNCGTYFAAYNDSFNLATTEELWTPSISTAGISDTLFVRYDYSFQDYVSNGDMWTIVRRYSGGVWSVWDTLVTRTEDTAGSDTFNLSSYVPADSIQIGWVYTQGAAEGWGIAIDNVQISTDLILDDNLTALSIITPATTIIAPAAFTPSFDLQNTGANNAFDYWVYFHITDKNSAVVYFDSMLISDTLLIDSIIQVNFINQQFSPAFMMTYTATAWVSMPADTYAADDTLAFPFRTYDLDVGCDTIYSPITVIDPAADIPVSGNFHNYATQAATFDCYVIIRDDVNFPVYTDNFHVANLAAGADTQIDFQDWLLPHAIGNYTIYMFSKVANDLDVSNDTSIVYGTANDPSAVWTDLTASSILPVQWPSACVDDSGRIYIAGAYGDGAMHPDVLVYDTISGWSVLDSLPITVIGPATFYKNGKLYVAGGMNLSFQGVKAMQIYDIAGDSWSVGTISPDPRGVVGGGMFDGMAYIIGGVDTLGNYATVPVWQYNPDADTAGGTPWTQMTDCPKTGGDGGFYCGTPFYGCLPSSQTPLIIAGDYQGDTDAYIYNPTADTAGGTPWAQIANLPAAAGKKNPVFAWDSDYYYLWGGDVAGSWGGPYTTASYYYSASDDAWFDWSRPLNYGMEGGVGAIIGDYIFTYGGTIGSGAINPAPFERTTRIGSATGSDYQAPYMTYTSPAHTAVNVALTAPVIIGFNEPIDTSAGFTFTFTPNPGLLTPVWNATLDTLIIYHNDFTFDVDYYVEITSAYDNAGWELISRSIPNPFGFSTGATGIDDNAKKANTFYISANRNIINDHAAFLFSVPSTGRTEIEIFNVLGEKVATVLDDDISAGTHTATWDLCNSSGRNVSSGIYLYKITSGDRTATGKLTLIK